MNKLFPQTALAQGTQQWLILLNFYLSALTSNKFQSVGSQFFQPPLPKKRLNACEELGLNLGPLAIVNMLGMLMFGNLAFRHKQDFSHETVGLLLLLGLEGNKLTKS